MVTGLGMRAAGGVQLRAGGLAAAERARLPAGGPPGGPPPCTPPPHSALGTGAQCSVAWSPTLPLLQPPNIIQRHPVSEEETEAQRGEATPRVTGLVSGGAETSVPAVGPPCAPRDPPATHGHLLAPALHDGCVLLGLQGVAGRLGGGLQLTRQVVAAGQSGSCGLPGATRGLPPSACQQLESGHPADSPGDRVQG